jgi:TetR/AcrR family transcriptional regulator, regulator of biofilm formation and stress response
VADENDLPDQLSSMPPSKRGVVRKTEILDAALRIIGRHGLGGLSMRALATEAHIPLGAVGYYFKGKQQLVAEAFQRHTQQETERVVKTITDLREGLTSEQLAARLADFVIEGLGPARQRLIAEYEFLVESSRRPELARTSSAWQQSLQAQLRRVVTSLGSSSPKTDTRLILAVLAGLEIDNLSTPLLPAQANMIKSVLRRLFMALECIRADAPSRSAKGEASIQSSR